MCIRDRVGCERAHRGGWLVVDAALLLVDTALLLLVTSAIPTVFEASHERLLVRLGTLARVTRLACPPRMLVLTHRSVLTDSTQLDLGRLGRRDRIDDATHHQRKAHSAPPDNVLDHGHEDEPESDNHKDGADDDAATKARTRG